MKTIRSLTSSAATRRPNRLTLAAMILVTAWTAPSSYAGFNQYSIGLNLGASDSNNGTGPRALDPTDVAGLPAVAQNNWNNLNGTTGLTNGPGVVDNSGAATTATVIWTTPLGTWSSGANNQFPTNSPNHTLMMGYLDNGTTATVTITNLPSQLTANGYDVYVYALYDTPNRGGTYSIVDGLNTATVLKAPQPFNSDNAPTNFVQCPGANTNQSGNYLVFHGLTSTNIQLVAVANHGGTLRAVIGAVQLVAAPVAGEAGPATGLNIVTNGQTGQLVISWTNGVNSQGALVVMRQGMQATAQPVDGQTYTASATFGAGTNLGDDEIGAGNFAVFAGPTSGASTSVTVSNLTPTVTYYVTVYSTTGTGGSTDYTLASPATGSAAAPGNIVSLNLLSPTDVVAGSARRFAVIANYDNGTSQNVASASSTISSNTSVVSILAPGRLAALTNGSAVLRAVYQGFTNTATVVVGNLAMKYEWSFGDEANSLTVTDTVVGAVGVVSNVDGFTGPTGTGLLSLGGQGGFVMLPRDLLTNYGALTIETWVTKGATATWQRMFDFGDNTTYNMFLTPDAGGSFVRLSLTTNGGGAESQVNYGIVPDTSSAHQYAVVVAGASRTAKMYYDGQLVAINTNFTLTPEDVGVTANDYLGKSQYATDPTFNGSMSEFRVYNGELDAFSIAAHNLNGPDNTSTNIGNIQTLAVTAPINPIDQFGTEQLSVVGTFDSGSVHLEAAPQTKYSTSSGVVATVNQYGVLTANGPGTALITVTSFGLTQSVSVVVSPLRPGLTHRYPFNNDFNDAIGTANATPQGAVGVDGNNATFSGVAGDYVSLPANLLLGYGALTLETWYTDNGSANWARLWDFGSSTANYMFLTPFVGGQPTTTRFAMLVAPAATYGGEHQINTFRPPNGVEHHAVLTINPTNTTARLYMDGLLVGENTAFPVTTTLMGQSPNNYLGRSQFADPYFAGLIDEFRVYNGLLSPVQVAVDLAVGPNSVTTNVGTLTTLSVVLTTNMIAGDQQQAIALVDLSNASGVKLSLGPSWSSSDPSVAAVGQDGVIRALKGGTATITAIFTSGTTLTNRADVIVTGPTLAHRWSFNDGTANDYVGGTFGTNAGGAVFTGTGLALDGTASSYVQLASDLLSNLNSVTFEVWLTYSNTYAANARVFDFGDFTRSNYLYFTASDASNPNNFSGSTRMRYAYINAAETSWIKAGRALSGGTNKIHYAYVLNAGSGRQQCYINGVLQEDYANSSSGRAPVQGYNGNAFFITNISSAQGFLGHASRTNSPPAANFTGVIDEFRMWNGPLSAAQVAISSALGPDNTSLDPGALQSLTMQLNDPTALVGGIQTPTIKAAYATAGTLDLTAIPGPVLNSDNPAVAVVLHGTFDQVQAVSPGTANITASFGGQTSTKAITVIAKQTRLMHRYSFNTDARDSVGTADGQLMGNATVANHAVVLTGESTPNTFVKLPRDIISGYDQITLEGFFTVTTNAPNTLGSQQRLFDFGDHVSTTGLNYLYAAPGLGTVGTPFGGNLQFNATSANFPLLNTNNGTYVTNVQFVVTLDSQANVLRLYTNGVAAGANTNVNITLNAVHDVYSQLGRSVWNDPFLKGLIHEFRVYSGILSPADIAASYAAGPDPETLTATLGPALGQVTVSWPATMLTTGYSLQTATSLSPPVTWNPAGAATTIGGINYVTLGVTNSASFYRLIK